MPVRKNRKENPECSLGELLNWVAFDDFGGAELIVDEVAAQVFGMPDNLEAIEIAQFQRKQAEDEARADIADALNSGEIVASGFPGTVFSRKNSDWKSKEWLEFQNFKQEIPQNELPLARIDFVENSIRHPSGIYVGVTVPRQDVVSVWPLEFENTSGKDSDYPKGSYRAFKRDLLVALAKEDSSSGTDFHDLRSVADKHELTYHSGWVRKAANDFDSQGYIQNAFTIGGGEDGGLGCSLLGLGLEAAEELMNESEYSSVVVDIPAADRIVRKNDNQAAWEATVTGIESLRSAMEATNDHGDLTNEEFDQRISEVRALQILFDAPQVQWTAVERFAENTVKYLAVKFTENAIGMAASALTGYLAALAGMAL